MEKMLVWLTFSGLVKNTHKTSISSELQLNVRHTSKENFEPAKSKPHKKKIRKMNKDKT